jgi:hypothetical protein
MSRIAGPIAILEKIGGEPLEGSGFENELPDEAIRSVANDMTVDLSLPQENGNE